MMLHRLLVLAVGLAPFSGAASPVDAQSPVKVGEEAPYQASTPSAYPEGDPTRSVTWSESVAAPGAAFLRIHFSNFHLPDGDYLTVAGSNGEDLWIYTGKGPQGTGEFWSFAVEDDVARIELHAGPARKGHRLGYGVAIDRIAQGTAPLSIESESERVICGDDGRRNAICQPGVNTKPVARILYQSRGSTFACTGFLVAGSQANTLIGAYACVSDQAEANTVQAKFNYQTTTCAGTTPAATTDYAGGTLLKTSEKLDYSLMTLRGNPEATWGEYTATKRLPSLGTPINFPHHPSGGLKMIGFWEDVARTTRCKVERVNASYGNAARGSQVSYGCDTGQSAAGGPILNATTGRVIGLHHFGGVENFPCLNSGTQMRQICAHAGTLLRCANN